MNWLHRAGNFFWRCAYRVAFPCFRVYCFLLRPKVKSAHVFVWSGDKLLVVRHSYKRGIAAPAGMVHPSEPAIFGAARELREEVGIDVDPSRLQELASFETQREHARDSAHVFLLRVDPQPEVQIDRREIIRAEFMDLATVDATRHRPIFTEALERARPFLETPPS